MKRVKIWIEDLEIPTYPVGKPEKNPIFIEKRVYQGSTGKIYPYPVIEKIHDQKINKVWKAAFLESEYIKIMVLPEIGGRIQMAYDKTRERHFVYYNEVIKPALIGLTGPWISGGIEFNWPQHHRPTTFDPVDFSIEEFDDGSATIWCSELERMFRTKGMTGFTLYPDKAYIEIKVRLYNSTPLPQTFLWWANPAVKVNDYYQSVFPPDVNAVFDHGKRDVSTFPIATGTYKKVDYSPGTDISMYKNIPVPTSYMVAKSRYDFLGGYEHDTKGGVLHVANHHISPGKKQWTWGNGKFGRAWDRNLTDGDEAYVELMCGVYTDNQPDFSWIMPHEEKSFSQYFFPYHELGVVKNATREASINIDAGTDFFELRILTTSILNDCKIAVYKGDTVIFEDHYDASPTKIYSKKIKPDTDYNFKELSFKVLDNDGNELVSWAPEVSNINDIPLPAIAPMEPEKVESIEELFLIGQHIEQYRHATYNPLDYYNEALRRTPGDIRCNNAIGLWFLRNGMFEKAEGHFMRAIQTMSKYNSNPINGEPLFNLGLALKYLGRNEEAYDKFYKSTWNSSFKNAGFYHIAQLDLMNGKPDRALQHIEESLNKNYSDHKARHLKIIVLRKLNRYEEALQIARESLELDHFNFGALYEYYLLTGKSKDLDNFSHLIRGNIHNYIEYSLDYAMAGLFGDAMELMDHGIKNSESNYPIAYYYMGWFAHLAGKKETSEEWFKKARQQKPDYCFPHQIESAIALEVAICLDPSDARAYYYLGNLWYNARQYDKATKYWEKAIQYDQKFPTPFRNLALSYFNKSRNKEKALITMEKAFQLDKSDSRVFMELCQLYKLVNKDLIFRLKFFENHAELVEERDDLYLELVMLQNNLGNHQIAFDLLKRRKFKPWEGGEGKVINQYITSLIELSKECMLDGDYPKAIALLHQSRVFPVNLGEDRLFDTRDSEIDFWLGTAYRIAGNEKNASVHFIKASKGLGELGITMFYDDQPPEDLFYKGLALKALDNHDKSEEIFQNLISYGKKHINDHIKIDYFAISLPDLSIWDKDLDLHNHIHCRYITGLGLTGSGLIQDAENEYDIVLNLDKNHQGAIIHRIMIQQKSLFI